MLKLTKTVNYVLFRPTTLKCTHYFTRIWTEGKEDIQWAIGRESNGIWHPNGGSLSSELSDELEKEYQRKLTGERDEKVYW